MYHTFRGHATEIVCLSFDPNGAVVATGSMDNTARLWDVETGECLHTLLGHTAEVIDWKVMNTEITGAICKWSSTGWQAAWIIDLELSRMSF